MIRYRVIVYKTVSVIIQAVCDTFVTSLRNYADAMVESWAFVPSCDPPHSSQPHQVHSQTHLEIPPWF